MRIGPLGTRELVAIGLMVVASVVALAVTFFRQEDKSQVDAAERVQLERTLEANPSLRTQTVRAAAETAGAQPTKTPTPGPRVNLSPPGAWQVSYQELRGESVVAQVDTGAEKLEVSFERAPYLDWKDDSWQVYAQAAVSGQKPGTWTFTIEYQGSLKIALGERTVAEAQSSSRTKYEVKVPVTTPDAPLFITVRDTGGPLYLAWK